MIIHVGDRPQLSHAQQPTSDEPSLAIQRLLCEARNFEYQILRQTGVPCSHSWDTGGV